MPTGPVRKQAKVGGVELPGQSVVAHRPGCQQPLWQSAKTGAASTATVVGVESTAAGAVGRALGVQQRLPDAQ
ncbi:hypothetical protein D3C76_1624900 [compost metagenome]